MSAKIKKAGRFGTKIVAAFLFLVLVMFNVEVGLYDGESSERGILGLTMSVFVPGAFADDQPGEQGPTSCYPRVNKALFWYATTYCATCSSTWGRGSGDMGQCG